jgi:dihydroxy-acid dehydratase
LFVGGREVCPLLPTRQPAPRPAAERGYRKLFFESVTQADQGVDFDFLRGQPAGIAVPRSD